MIQLLQFHGFQQGFACSIVCCPFVLPKLNAQCTEYHSRAMNGLVLKGMAVMLPDNLKLEWYVWNDGI